MENIVEELMLIVNNTLEDLYKNDKYLLENDSSERNIVFHFGRYFIKNLEKNNFFKNNNYNVDYEYNKDVFNEKKYKEVVYEGKKHKIFPDILLHERGSNDNNILAIEFKKYSNTNQNGKKIDEYKLKALTDNKLHFKYQMGLFIELGKTINTVKIKKFIDGKKVRGK